MRRVTTIAIASLLCLTVFTGKWAHAVTITGNTGPGGVGRTDIASSLLYWLEADSIGVGNGNPVPAWNDTKTFSPKNFLQGTAPQQPVFVSSGINGHPTVVFDGAASPNHDKLVLSTSTTPRTFIIVNQVGIGQGGSCCVGLVGIDGGDYGIRRESSNTSVWRGTTAQTPTLTVASDFTFAAGSSMHVNGANTATAAEGLSHILSASSGTSTAFASTGLADYFLSAGARRWKGQIGEVIAFDTVATATQRVLVENYLSAKFTIPLNTGSGAIDVYAGDAPTVDFDFDVFGIGNDGVSSVTTSGSHGFGIEATGGTLGTNEWVLAGHKVNANNATTPAEGLDALRWARTWYVDKTGTVDATLAFDFSDAGLGSPVGDQLLLYRPDEISGWTVLASPTSITGDLFTFALNDSLLQDGIYTLGVLQVPEPSSLALLALGTIGMVVRARRCRLGRRQ